jgi:Kef-type K+ transport system membrane component KefB
MAALGPAFGITRMQSIRAGMLLAAGGEFAFVAFGGNSFVSAASA